MSSPSCTASRLERYIALTDAEGAFLCEMEREERELSAGDVICRKGEQSTSIYILKVGWAIVRSRAERGRSQILHIHLPGEVIGLAELGSGVAPHDLIMQTEGTICPFPSAGLAGMYERVPRLAALLTALSNLDQVALRDRIFSLSRLSAEHRLIHFLLQLGDRLNVVDVGGGNRLYLPLNQAEIGDVLGLTSVYVNKLLRGLVMSNRIQMEKPHVRLLERELLARQVGYESRFTELEDSWFPEAR